MKTSLFLSAGAALLLLNTATAQDLDTRLLGDSPEGIRSAAKEVHRAGHGEPATLDLMAEVLLRNAGASDPRTADAMAWICIALGKAGGPRYFESLRQAAAHPQAHGKVAEHCEEAAEDWDGPTVPQYTAGSVDYAARKAQAAASGALAPPPTAGGPRQRLLSGDYRVVRGAAKEVYGAGGGDRETLDTMAELLLRNAAVADTDPLRIDATAWLCLALGKSGDRRYFSALQQVADQRHLPEKISGHCTAARKQLRGPAGEQYARGMTDRPGLPQPAATVVAPASIEVASAAPVATVTAPPAPSRPAPSAEPPPGPLVLKLGAPGVPADLPFEYHDGTPQPIAGGHGAFVSPFTEDGTVAPWVAKAMAVKAGGALGSAAGGYAAQYAADKAMEQAGAFIPGLSFFTNKLGKAAGEAAGRNAAIAAAGGWEFIRSTSDLSFRSVHELAQFMVLRNQSHPDFPKVVEAGSSIYPELQQAVSRQYR